MVPTHKYTHKREPPNGPTVPLAHMPVLAVVVPAGVYPRRSACDKSILTAINMESEPDTHPATVEEAELLDALVRCKLPPRNADVRFVLEMHCAARDRRAIMTAGRRAYLWRIAYRYRVQLPPELSRIAEERQATIWHPDAT